MTLSWQETLQVLTCQPHSSGSTLPTCGTTRLQVQTLASTYTFKLLPSLNHVISGPGLPYSLAWHWPPPQPALSLMLVLEHINVSSEDREEQTVRDNQISRAGWGLTVWNSKLECLGSKLALFLAFSMQRTSRAEDAQSREQHSSWNLNAPSSIVFRLIYATIQVYTSAVIS